MLSLVECFILYSGILLYNSLFISPSRLLLNTLNYTKNDQYLMGKSQNNTTMKVKCLHVLANSISKNTK